MTRFSASENATASQLAHVSYRVFASLDFLSGTIRLCSGDEDETWGGFTWTALGKFGAISPIKESADSGPEGLQLTLTGVDNSLITTTLTEKYHNRSVVIYVGYLSDAGALVATPHQIWEGRMDTLSIQTDDSTSIIVVNCENRLILWAKASGWLYTHEHQGLLTDVSPDDFFDQVQAIADKVVKWGGTLVVTGGGGNIGGPGGGRDTRPHAGALFF